MRIKFVDTCLLCLLRLFSHWYQMVETLSFPLSSRMLRPWVSVGMWRCGRRWPTCEPRQSPHGSVRGARTEEIVCQCNQLGLSGQEQEPVLNKSKPNWLWSIRKERVPLNDTMANKKATTVRNTTMALSRLIRIGDINIFLLYVFMFSIFSRFQGNLHHQHLLQCNYKLSPKTLFYAMLCSCYCCQDCLLLNYTLYCRLLAC